MPFIKKVDGVSVRDYKAEKWTDTAVVDHCHTTGKVRGILCNECNRGLGYFKDNKMSLNNAIQYLTETESSEGGQCSCRS